MKRDFDLVRSILIKLEESDPGNLVRLQDFVDLGEREIVVEHILLLIEAGFIEGKPVPLMRGYADVLIQRLTWQGHEFIDSIRNETVWNKVKGTLLKTTGSLTIDLISTTAQKVLAQMSGLG